MLIRPAFWGHWARKKSASTSYQIWTHIDHKGIKDGAYFGERKNWEFNLAFHWQFKVNKSNPMYAEGPSSIHAFILPTRNKLWVMRVSEELSENFVGEQSVFSNLIVVIVIPFWEPYFNGLQRKWEAPRASIFVGGSMAMSLFYRRKKVSFHNFRNTTTSESSNKFRQRKRIRYNIWYAVTLVLFNDIRNTL